MSGPPYSPEDIARASNLDVEQVRVLATVLGYDADEGVDEPAHQMLLMVGKMVTAGLAWEGVLEGARVFVDAIGKLADFGINMTHRYFCEPMEQAGRTDQEIAELFGDAGGSIGPASEELMVSMYRYYLARALAAHARSHLEPRDPDAAPGSVKATMLFVDLALFSSLADTQGDVEAMRLIDRFDQSVRVYSLKHEGRLVKQIGDEFMLVFRDPVAAVRFAVDVHETMARTEKFVALRTGIHSGSVLYRVGDYYGHAVNITARLVSMAMPNAILVTEPVAKAAADAGIEVEEIGVRSLRGMEEPLALYRVVS